jgi:hypothetical protein
MSFKFKLVDYVGFKWLKNITESCGAKNMIINSKPDNNIAIESLILYNNRERRLWIDITASELLELTKENNGIYEIITDYPYKIYFDYDARKEEDIIYNEKKRLEDVKNKLLELFEGCIMSISGSITAKKTSYHIILSNYLIYNEEDHKQLKSLVKYLNNNFDSNFDDSIYTRNRNMKCINQSKPDGRIQKIIENTNIKDHYITCFLEEYDNKRIPKFNFIEEKRYIEENKKIINKRTSINTYINICNLNYEYNSNELELFNLLSLNRVEEYNSWFELGLLCYSLYDVNGYNIYKELSEKSVKFNIDEFNSKWNNIINTIEKRYNFNTLCKWCREDNLTEYNNHRIKYFTLKNNNKININKIIICQRYLLNKEKLLLDNNILSNNINMFLNSKEYLILTIKSPYDTGKTQLIKEIFLRYPKKRILWLSYRITLTLDLMKTFQEFNFETYVNNLNADRLIIQLESLLKLKKDNRIPIYDLILFDESESLLYQFHSTATFKYRSRDTFDFLSAIITSSLNNNGKVIALDGDLSDRSYHYFNSFGKTLNIVNDIVFNDFTIVIENNKNKFEEDIIETLKKNKKIVIASMSANYVNEFSKRLLEIYPEKKIKLYTSDSDGKEKKKLINVDDEWEDVDILLYSPTISAGVSYDKLNHFNKLYGIMCNNSCSPRDFHQMLRRIRKIDNKQIQIYNLNQLSLNDNFSYYTYDYILSLDKSYRSYYDTKNCMYIDEQDLYDEIYAYNEAEVKNKDHNFLFIFIKMAKEKGYYIKFNHTKVEKSNKKEIKYKSIEIYETKDITKDLYNTLCEKKIYLDTTYEENIQIEKYKLKEFLGLDILNLDIIDRFYKNTSIINNFCYLIDNNNIIQTNDNNFNELKYKTETIRELIVLLGYNNIFDNKSILSETLKENINKLKINKINIYSKNNEADIFKYDKIREDILKSDLGHINSIINKFGINIKLQQLNTRENKKFIKINYYNINILYNIHELIYYKKLRGFELYDSCNIFKNPSIYIYDKLINIDNIEKNKYYYNKNNLLDLFDTETDYI